MTLNEFSDFVKSIKYKPGFTLKLGGRVYNKSLESFVDSELKIQDISEDVPETDLFHLEFKMYVTDAYDPSFEKIVPLTKKVSISKHEIKTLDREMWESIIYRHLLQMETHEIGEFFRVGNRRPFDPHRKKGNA
jgi:hypothetical protein